MQNNTPKATDSLHKRAECYAKHDFAALHTLYSTESEFRQFFPDEASYVAHAKEHGSKLIFQGLVVIEEKSRGKLAQILSRESFISEGNPISYQTKSTLKLEDGQWRIVSEERSLIDDPKFSE